jgi:hypothetical protein
MHIVLFIFYNDDQASEVRSSQVSGVTRAGVSRPRVRSRKDDKAEQWVVEQSTDRVSDLVRNGAACADDVCPAACLAIGHACLACRHKKVRPAGFPTGLCVRSARRLADALLSLLAPRMYLALSPAYARSAIGS